MSIIVTLLIVFLIAVIVQAIWARVPPIAEFSWFVWVIALVVVIGVLTGQVPRLSIKGW